jgi:hypothetical protein
MLFTFDSTSITNITAETTDTLGTFAAACHRFHRHRTGGRAILIQMDAANHRPYIALIQTVSSTTFALDNAVGAGCDAGLKFLSVLLARSALLVGRRDFDCFLRLPLGVSQKR